MKNIVHSRLIRLLGDEVVGGIVSGFGSIIGSAINARSQERQNKANLKAQQEENEKSRQFTEDMYNKYESPVAQRQQMLEAGLNPMGAISPQSVGSASTSALPPGQAPEYGSAIQQGIQAFFDAGTTIRAQRLQDQEIEKAKLDNWMQAFQNGNAQALLDTQLAEIRSRTAFNRQEKRLKKQEERRLILEYNKAKEAYYAGINEHVDEHNESVARTGNLGADTDLKASQKLLSDMQQITEGLRQSNISADTSLKQKQTDTESQRAVALDLENKLTHFFGPMEHWGNLNIMQAQYDKLVAEEGKIEADRFMLGLHYQLELLKLEYQDLWVDKNINSNERQAIMKNLTTLGDSLIKLGFGGNNK